MAEFSLLLCCKTKQFKFKMTLIKSEEISFETFEFMPIEALLGISY